MSSRDLGDRGDDLNSFWSPAGVWFIHVSSRVTGTLRQGPEMLGPAAQFLTWTCCVGCHHSRRRSSASRWGLGWAGPLRSGGRLPLPSVGRSLCYRTGNLTHTSLSGKERPAEVLRLHRQPRARGPCTPLSAPCTGGSSFLRPLRRAGRATSPPLSSLARKDDGVECPWPSWVCPTCLNRSPEASGRKAALPAA